MRDDRGDGYERAFWPTVSCSKYKAVEMDRISRRLELCSSSCRLEMEGHENEGTKMALRTERGKG